MSPSVAPPTPSSTVPAANVGPYVESSGHGLLRRWLDRLPVGWVLNLERLKRAVLPADSYRRARELYHKLGKPQIVLDGPFAGMRYVTEAYDSGFLPRLLGTYEWELADAVIRLAGSGVDRVVDIGAAEGYYAVGLARRIGPPARVIGFDGNRRARHLLGRMARINGVTDRIDVRGLCDPPALADALAGADRPLVICDCEGYEAELLDLELVPALGRASVVVELHDHLFPGASEAIRARFDATHEIDVIAHDPVGPPLPTHATPLLEAEWRQATREGRVADQHWFVMTPRTAT